MKYEISAGAVVFYKEMQAEQPLYLILKYSTGHWDFPKGKLESGETCEDAALREIKEETHLDVVLDTHFKSEIGYFYMNSDGLRVSKTVVFYVAQADPLQKVQLSHEHQAYEWLFYEEALSLLTYQNAREVLLKAHAFLTV